MVLSFIFFWVWFEFFFFFFFFFRVWFEFRLVFFFFFWGGMVLVCFLLVCFGFEFYFFLGLV